jgi:hypothetical protein
VCLIKIPMQNTAWLKLYRTLPLRQDVSHHGPLTFALAGWFGAYYSSFEHHLFAFLS